MSVFTSRRFWVSVFTLLVMLILPHVPGFHLDVVNSAGFIVIVISYLIGITVDPGPGGWAGVLQSRKFWAAVIGFVFVILNGFGIVLVYGMGQDQILVIVVTIAGYISAVAFQVAPPPPVEDEKTKPGFSFLTPRR
jgi:hypothetical protein